VLDARNAGVSYKEIGIQVLGFSKGDYAQAMSNAQAVHEAAKGMWRKIRAERVEGPVLGFEDVRFQDSFNVIPPFKDGSARLDNWLNCLHPRLHQLLLPSLR
jgi:hypothetical protein